MSEALVWHLIRDHNSFLVRRGRSRVAGEVQFSKEPGNVMNVNTFKFSGLANNKTIDVSTEVKDAKTKKLGKNIKKAVVVVKSKSVDKKAVNKPKLSVDKNVIISSWKLNKKATVPDSHAILSTLEKDGYRKDLISAAKHRLSKLYKASCVKNKSAPGAIVGTKRHSKK